MREIHANVSDRGRVTLPAEVRRALGLKKGDDVIFVIEDEGAVRVRKRWTLENIAGSVPALDPPRTWEEVKRIVAEEVAERYAEKMRKGNA